MARTYNAQRTLGTRRNHRQDARQTPDARQERKAARQALRQVRAYVGNSATLWQNRDTQAAGKPSDSVEQTVAPGLQANVSEVTR